MNVTKRFEAGVYGEFRNLTNVKLIKCATIRYMKIVIFENKNI